MREGPRPRKSPHLRIPRPGYSWVPLLPRAPVLCILTPGTSSQPIPSYGAEGPEDQCTGGQPDPSAPDLASQGRARSAAVGPGQSPVGRRPLSAGCGATTAWSCQWTSGRGRCRHRHEARAHAHTHTHTHTHSTQMHTHGPGQPEPLLLGVKAQQVWCRGSGDPAEACPPPACPRLLGGTQGQCWLWDPARATQG